MTFDFDTACNVVQRHVVLQHEGNLFGLGTFVVQAGAV